MKKLIVISLFAMLVLASCNLMQGDGVPTATVAPVDALRTSAAKTVDALSTSLAMNKTIAPTAAGQGTSPVKTQTLPAQTIAPSFTPKPSNTPLPAQATATTIACDQAAFIRDVTVPDGTFFHPNTVFTKTWELKNVGSCTWNSNYALVFQEGNTMKAVATKPLVAANTTVAPNQTVLISVEMTAPGSTGKVESLWKLKNSNGETFGVGVGGTKAFWASIVVAEKFTLLDNLCSAEWRNGSALLPCPGKTSDKTGSVTKVSEPKFINGYVEDEPGILMIPQAVTDGIIVGKFPPMRVPTKAAFQTLVVCAFESPKCNAKVVLTYQIGSEAEKVLVEMVKKADNEASPINIDLTAQGLGGKTVVFRLYVKANGASTDDRIYWINPQLKAVP